MSPRERERCRRSRMQKVSDAAGPGCSRCRMSAATRVKRKNYPATVIAQAIALLMSGETVQQVADKLNIPKQTISDWKQRIPQDSGQIRTKKEVIADLVGQNIEAILRANLAQLVAATDEAYLRRQPAGELAILYGTICDKGFRFLDAAARAERGASAPSVPGLPPGDAG